MKLLTDEFPTLTQMMQTNESHTTISTHTTASTSTTDSLNGGQTNGGETNVFIYR